MEGELNSSVEQNATLKTKVEELSIGFEYIKLYGFDPNHFEQVLKAYNKSGKFPDPAQVKKAAKKEEVKE